jgi:aryl-alcohol dehydrogenase-like predicted oxidoreductase
MFYWRGRLRRGMEESRQLVSVLEEIAAKHGATIGQVALNWVIHFQGETVVTIPGVTSASQAAENAGAMKFKLTSDEMQHLEELSRSFR